MLAVVSTRPNQFAALGLPDGPFTKIEGNAAAAKAIVKIMNTPVNGCDSPTRDFAVEPAQCSTGYGAAHLDVQEFE